MSLFSKIKISTVLFFVLIQSSALLAQTISGKVISQSDKTPMPFANVFLNNTQIGTTTAESGNFTLKNIPEGNYELIVSYIGYEVASQTIRVEKENQPIEIELIPKNTQLAEVVIKEDKNWKINYDYFVENFIGKTSLASQCKIINPDVIYLKYDYDSLILKVRTDEFLIIENKALGYRIKYLLVSFRDDAQSKYQSTLGYTLFEELKGSKRQNKKWEQEREKAYRGSFNHFCKALLDNSCFKEGFLVRKLKRDPNPDRLSDETIRAGIKRLRDKSEVLDSDSLLYWSEESKKPRLRETLFSDTINTDTLLRQEKGYTILRFEDYLYVVYTKEKEDDLYLIQKRKFGESVPQKSFQSSVISLITTAAVFDSKGYLLNPLSILSEEYWAWQEKVAELLPTDYIYKQK